MSESYQEKLQSPRWQKKKYEIYERDNYRCVRCGNPDRPLRVHHIKYEYGKDPWEYENDFLITLCDKHHSEEHEAKKIFNNILAETLKDGFFYSDMLDIWVELLKPLKSRYSFTQLYHRLCKLSSDIEQDLDL